MRGGAPLSTACRAARWPNTPPRALTVPSDIAVYRPTRHCAPLTTGPIHDAEQLLSCFRPVHFLTQPGDLRHQFLTGVVREEYAMVGGGGRRRRWDLSASALEGARAANQVQPPSLKLLCSGWLWHLAKPYSSARTSLYGLIPLTTSGLGLGVGRDG